MSRLFNSSSVILAVVFCGVFSQSASAAILTSHAYAGIRIDALDEPYHLTIRLEGEGPLNTEFHSFEYEDVFIHATSSAHAKADIYADRFLKSFANAYNSQAGLYAGHAQSHGVAAWRDVVLGPTATHVRLNFRFDGDLSASSVTTGFLNNWAEFGIRTTTNPYIDHDTFFEQVEAEFPITGTATYDYEAVVYDGNQQGGTSAPGGISGNGFTAATGNYAWDSFEYSGGHFTGFFHIDTEYDASLGGYGWGVSLNARACGLGGQAEADALGTLTLQQVTLPDGTPLDVTFDSGLQIPEPGSITLLVCGMVAGLIWWWRRRR